MLTTTTSTDWRNRFLARHNQHRDVVVAGVEVPAEQREAFGASIATFQLGESGTGEHLLAAARRAGADDDYVESLRLFVVEEQEHARLLALVLRDLDLPLRDRHWSDRIFVLIRRLHSLRTEVLVLLVAEVIALTYYAALRDGMADATLRDVFGRIQGDEVVHVDFHGETLPPHLAALSPVLRRLGRLLWNLLVIGASVAVALDHGRVLRSVGVSRPAFLRRVWRDRRALDQRLFGG